MRELFLTSFSGWQYGIWKDRIKSVRDIHDLHRIPLSPAMIAGILIDNGQTVTLADLSACIGYGHTKGIAQGSILLMEEGEKVTGFAVSGGMDVRAVSPESLFQLPDFLKTPVFDTCAVHDGIPVPIINVAELYSRVMKTGGEASANSPRTSARPPDISGMARIRLFSAAGELFAAPAGGIDDNPVRPGAVTPLPNMPPYVKGVTFRDGRLLPVIDLPQRIKRQGAAPEPLMLIAGIAGETFGLLVDGDMGTVPAHSVAIKPVPMIASKPWFKHMVVRDGGLIPLVDLAIALSPDSGAADEIPVWQRYAPGSRFPDVFFKHDAEVVEFSLLGERHALPKQEVEEVIACKPWRELPDAPPIVLGVAEHNGGILPVVDLAMMFGRLSLVTPAWRMMLVSNGDFRALVVTETVFKERRLAPDIHRAVPIHLPHNLMYGCYPDAQVVRLILNVEAISVHFENSLIQKFLPALSHGMKMVSAQAAPDHQEKSTREIESGHEIEPAREIEPVREVEPVEALSAAEPETLAPQEQASVHRPADEAAQELQRQAVEQVIESIGEHEAAAETVAIAPEAKLMDGIHAVAPSASALDMPSSSDGWSEREADEALAQEHAPNAEAVTEIAMEPAVMSEASTGGGYDAAELNDMATSSSFSENELQQLAEVSDIEFTEVQESISDENAVSPEPAAPPDNVTSGQSSGESNNALVSIAASVQSPVETVLAPAQEWVKDKSETKPVAASTKPGVTKYQIERTVAARKRGAAYSAIAAVLLAVFYFVWSFDKTGAGKPERVAQAAKAGQDRVQAEPVKTAGEPAMESAGQVKSQAAQAEAQALAEHQAQVRGDLDARTNPETRAQAEQSPVLGKQDKAQAEPPRLAEKPHARLELDIPKNMTVDIDVYVVKKGDTLWSISERYTGTPFNYPRIAGENRIADPDLIFPGQRIRLNK